MVVQSRIVDLSALDLSHLALFLGLRVNELVVTRMTRAGFRNVRESHGYLIQHLIESDRSITELARRMEVSQQAASKSVAELVRLGVLEELPAKDRRAKRIRLSARGWKAVHASRKIRAGIHENLYRTVGERNIARAKRTLIACLDQLGATGRIKGRRLRQPG
jgi:DNA-binding MarR family transcriptional regulator